MEGKENGDSIVGKLHINYMENDTLIHCTDNPGRTTFYRTSVLQRQKQNDECTFDIAYKLCINELIQSCKVLKPVINYL